MSTFYDEESVPPVPSEEEKYQHWLRVKPYFDQWLAVGVDGILEKHREELRGERFHFYQMGLKEARAIAVLVHELLGHSWNAFVSSAQDGARQACNRIIKDIDKALAVGIDDDAI